MAITYREQEITPQFTARDYNALNAFLSIHARTWMSATLALADAAGLILAGVLALEVRSLFGLLPFNLFLYNRFALLVLVFIGVFAVRGLYPAIGLSAVEQLRRLIINITLVFLAIAAYTFLDQTPPVYSRFIYLITWLFALVLVPFSRFLVRKALTSINLWGEPVVVVGQPEKVAEISASLIRNPQIGLKPIPACTGGSCPAIVGRQAFQLPDQGCSAACRGCPVLKARMALIVYSDYNEISAVREKYRDTFRRVVLINYLDHGLELSGISVKDFGNLTGFELHQNLLDRWAQSQKRLLDIIGSFFGIIFLSPLFLLIAASIYIDSPGRIFYRQLRVGKGGRHFNLLKFRTMHLNADKVLHSYLEKDPALKQEWDQYQKLQKDPRITRVGNLLRRFSIDELTQLWNVFLGEMSLVGPRPMMVNQVDAYGKPYEHYIRVTPGITGLWQVSGRNKTTFARRAELDVNYVMNWSIWLDLYILIRTVLVVITRDGAA